MLPKLPKQNKHKESTFGSKLEAWFLKNPMFSCALEAKQTDTDSIPFLCVKDEQLEWGMAIRSRKGIMARIAPVVEGMPDYIWCRNMPSFVVIKFPKFFCLISVPVFIQERNRSKRKSLTSSRAKEISTVVVDN